jgi:hypothetical protein
MVSADALFGEAREEIGLDALDLFCSCWDGIAENAEAVKLGWPAPDT